MHQIQTGPKYDKLLLQPPLLQLYNHTAHSRFVVLLHRRLYFDSTLHLAVFKENIGRRIHNGFLLPLGWVLGVWAHWDNSPSCLLQNAKHKEIASRHHQISVPRSPKQQIQDHLFVFEISPCSSCSGNQYRISEQSRVGISAEHFLGNGRIFGRNFVLDAIQFLFHQHISDNF
jgi:hypothetical protein